MVAGGHGSASPAASAHCARPAPPASVAGSSPSIPARPPWPPPGPANATPPGWPTIGPPGPRWNASSPTCCAAATAAGAPQSGGWCAWPRTSSCWPPRSTWPAWPPSGCAPPPPAGSSSPPDGGDQLPRHLSGNRYLNAAELLQLVREHRPPSRRAIVVLPEPGSPQTRIRFGRSHNLAVISSLLYITFSNRKTEHILV